MRMVTLAIGALWLAFQMWIVFYPQAPLVERPLHLLLALTLVLLFNPLSTTGASRRRNRLTDALLLAGTLAVFAYYALSSTRLTERMETIDPVLAVDVAAFALIIALLFEGVRRTVGWPLLGVLLVFFAYAFIGKMLPGAFGFRGFTIDEVVEIMTMTTNGVLGITTATSLQFVFYFVLFGAVYSGIGGGQLFIDLALKVAGRFAGGAAKAAVVSSSLMGSISGSAVANVATTGVFTIPLMRKTGYGPAHAGAVEAIASTGGQLMPPIMGIAAFVMAEMLQISYARIAAAGLIPALAFYTAIFIFIDLRARAEGALALDARELTPEDPIAGRLYLLLPPLVLIAMLVAGFSATYAAVIGTASCVVVAYLRRKSWLNVSEWFEVVRSGARQAAEIAVPIAAIGIIIAVAIQSNLALKFSSGLIGASGGKLYLAMFLIIIGCLIMGMGLPTVAAYIIGAILFVPALKDLGIAELPAHFFVMYYCVLSMVTPPVALASFTAAGISGAGSMETSLIAFRLSLVSFLIPFAFAFDPRLLGQGDLGWVALACISLFGATGAWAVALSGYLRGFLRLPERALYGAVAVAVILFPTGGAAWVFAFTALLVLAAWGIWLGPRLRASGREGV